MGPAFPGSFRLFRLAGIDVFMHWTWFVVAFLEIQLRAGYYDNGVLNAVEFLALFLIVLLHEFGHAFACRQVGGEADRILLWPLGGVAFVAPPPRPGALLWSIAAGPLVNVALVPVTLAALAVAWGLGWQETFSDGWYLACSVAVINFGLLVFNLLPIYPLDGGQILYAALWFFIGRVNALLAVSLVGLFGAACAAGLAVLLRNPVVAILAAFIALRAFVGLQQARAMAHAFAGPRHTGFACPGCNAAPPAGPFWGCDKCGSRFDTFACGGICPGCGRPFPETVCAECRQRYPLRMWQRGGALTTERDIDRNDADAGREEGRAW